MPGYKGGGYKRKGVIYEGPTRPKGRPKKSASKAEVKTIVERAISNNISEKCAVREVFRQISVPGTGLDVSIPTPLGLTTQSGIIPFIAQGTGDADRKDASIKVNRLVVKWFIRANDITNAVGTNPYKNPFLVRMIVYNHRYAMDDYDVRNILDKGNTVGNLDSSPDTWLEPYDKKEFKIHYSKEYKMAPLMNYNAGGTVFATVENMPNGFKHFVSGTKEIKIPANLLYKDATGNQTNSMPQLAFAVCNIDGTPLLGTFFRATVNVETKLYYTDA